MSTWFQSVERDPSKLLDAIAYYEAELVMAKKECKLTGNIEQAAASLPGIVEHRYSQLQDIEAILESLNIDLRRARSACFRKYLETYSRALSSRECDKFVDGEQSIIDLEKLINEFALLRNKWLGLHKALDIKQWQITNIIKLRCAGLDDATL